MNPILRLFAGGLASLAGLQMTVTAADWPHWRGPDYKGISAEKGWLAAWTGSGPKPRWRGAAGTGFSSFSVAGGRVFTMGNEAGTESVVAFDELTGKPLWKHSYPCPLDPNLYEGGPNATPTVDGDKVFTFSRQGQLFCLEAATGNVVWQRNLRQDTGAEEVEWGYSSSPLVQDRLLILNLGTAGTAVDKTTGKVVWSNGRGKGGYATPVPFEFNQRPFIALFGAKALSLLDPKTGKVAAGFPWETSYDINSADPIIAGQSIFISSGYNRGAALLNLASGKPALVWENKNMRNHFNPCVLIDGHLYGIDGNAGRGAALRCLDARTGAVKWSEASVGAGSLTAADGKLIVLSERGELLIAPASPDGFKPTGRAQVLGGRCWTTPVLANGRILCRNARGDVVSLDVSNSGAE